MAKTQKKSAALNIESHPTRKPIKAIAKVAEPLVSLPPRRGSNSKQSMLITLMRRAEGATLDELISATGWQRHSVRGTISGAVKKRLGFVITSNVEARGRVYRISGERR